MLGQLLDYLTDSGISGPERLLAILLPVVCFSATSYLLFSYLARRLVEGRKRGLLWFSFFCVVRLLSFAGLTAPWVAFLYAAANIALHP